MDDKGNTRHMERTQAQKEEDIKKSYLILKSLQSKVSALQKENDRLKKLQKDLDEKNAQYDFSLDNIHMAYDALMTISMNEQNHGKSIAVNNFEVAIHEIDELSIFCEAETQKQNSITKGEIKEIIEKSCAYRTEIDVCEKQITDLLVKKNKLAIRKSELDKEAADFRDHISHKQKESSELAAQVASLEEEAVMTNEFQDKLKNLKEMNQFLKARDKEMTKNIMQAQMMSEELRKSLRTKQKKSESLQKGINAIQKELKKERGFKSTKDLLKPYKKETKAINAEIDYFTTKLHKSDEEQHHLDIKKVQDVLAGIAAEREVFFKRRNKVPSELLEVCDVYYKKIENVYKKLMALHGYHAMSHCDQPEYQDNFKDEAIVEDTKVMESSRKEDFKREAAVSNNNEPFQKKAKCNGGNHPLPGNERIAPESVNETAENGLLNMDERIVVPYVQEVDELSDGLQKDVSECLELTSSVPPIHFDIGDNQPA